MKRKREPSRIYVVEETLFQQHPSRETVCSMIAALAGPEEIRLPGMPPEGYGLSATDGIELMRWQNRRDRAAPYRRRYERRRRAIAR